MQLYAALDATGKGACSTAQQSALDAAVSWIRGHYGDIGWSPSDCVPNGTPNACENKPDPTSCWGGVPFILPTGLNPLEEAALQMLYRAPARRVRDTLERSDLTLVIHCRNRFWRHRGVRLCKTWNKLTAGFAPCPSSYATTKKHINICEWYLDRVVAGDQTAEQLARIVLHEIFHVWGANESAAQAMENATGWSRPTF